MTFATFVPPVKQSPGTKMAPEIKTLSVDFGDGYTQDQPDGLNNIRQIATVTWSALKIDQFNVLMDFFVGQKGTIPFYYTLKDGVLRKWTCKEFSGSLDAPDTFTATLRESFLIDT